MDALSGTDALSVMNASRNSGYDDGFGGGCSWWIIIILFAFLGNGSNNDKDYATTEMVANEFTQRDIFNTNTSVLEGNNATQRALLESANATQRDILENRYTNQLGTQSIISSQKDCCCNTAQNILENRYENALSTANTQKEILQNRYDNSLQTNTLQAQIAQCCCNLEASNLAGVQKILDKMCETEVNNLRERLNERDRELQSAQFQISQVAQTNTLLSQINKVPVPSYLTCSPYMSSYYAYNGLNNCAGCNV